MELPSHSQFDEALAPQRGVKRRALQLAAFASSARHGRIAVELINLSGAGALLHSDTARMEPGEEIALELVEGEVAPAIVVWANDGFHGLSFRIPLDRGRVAAALLKAAAQPPAEAMPQLASMAALPPRQRGPTRLMPTVNFAVPVFLALTFWTLLGGAAWLWS